MSTDLNVMMREQARNGLQSQLDVAVTNGDTAAATKIADDIAKLAVANAPKAPPFGDADIRAELEKAPWFGIDPKKSAKAAEFGRTMDPKKFATAALFAAALVAAVDAEFKPSVKTTEDGSGENDDTDLDDDTEDDDAAEIERKAAAAKKRKTDGPGEGDAGNRSTRRTTSGPWLKLTDAPANVQAEIKRSETKLLSSNVSKEQRAKFIAGALESHYAIFQRTKGKK